jgi:hypothetical protein
MAEELDALQRSGTWDLVPLPEGKSVIGCRWVYKVQTRSDGTVGKGVAARQLAETETIDLRDYLFG